MTMNKKIADRWVKALRSGKFKQGKGRLNVAGKYCCLGVLCELAARSKKVEKARVRDLTMYSYDGSLASLPESVMKWVGIDAVVRGPAPGSFGVVGDTTLSRLNDYDCKTFDEIADIIEENYQNI
jgi:hypothetical protein